MGDLNEAGYDPLVYGSCLGEEDAVSFTLGTSELCLFLLCFLPQTSALFSEHKLWSTPTPLYLCLVSLLGLHCSQLCIVKEACI